MLNITDTRIRILEGNNSKLKAVASITIDNCFAVHDIKIIEGNDGIFIAMPSRKASDGMFKDIAHPINHDAREFVKSIILDAYRKAIEEI